MRHAYGIVAAGHCHACYAVDGYLRAGCEDGGAVEADGRSVGHGVVDAREAGDGQCGLHGTGRSGDGVGAFLEHFHFHDEAVFSDVDEVGHAAALVAALYGEGVDGHAFGHEEHLRLLACGDGDGCGLEAERAAYGALKPQLRNEVGAEHPGSIGAVAVEAEGEAVEEVAVDFIVGLRGAFGGGGVGGYRRVERAEHVDGIVVGEAVLGVLGRPR